MGTEHTVEKAAGDELAVTFSDAARRYSELGWAVTRIHIGEKRPVGEEWQKAKPLEPGAAAGQWAVWGGRYNMGVVAGPSGVVVFEYDKDAYALFLELLGGELPQTPICRSGSGRLHVYFADPGDVSKSTRDDLELRVGGHQCLVWPSTHPETGRQYEWLEGREPWTLPCAPLPDSVREFFRASVKAGQSPLAEKLPPVIKDGAWHETMVSAAGTLRARGFTEQAAVAALLEQNATYDGDLVDDGSDIRELVGDVYERYQADRDIPVKREYAGPQRALDEVVATFQRWLYLPDPGALYVALAAVIANRLPGDPLWLLLVAASSSGKTEVLVSLCGLAEVVQAATLTEAGLLSGSARKDRGAGATGGLLSKLGDYGIVMCKDFGSVLSMHREARASVLAALREVFDGSWDRHVGVDGGKTLHWDGKVGLIGGVTTVVDSHHAVMDSLGSRFALYRVEVDDRGKQGERSLRHRRGVRGMRSELQDAVSGFLAGVELPADDSLTRGDGRRVVRLADLVTMARSPVERDGYSREIEMIPDPEAPARFVNMLAGLLEGLRVIGLDDEDAWRLVSKTAYDSMPAKRRRILELLSGSGDVTTKAAALELGLPTSTARRTLEDLAAHGVVTRSSGGEGSADTWQLSAWTRARYGE